MKLAPGRYCACRCERSLAAYRADAKWAGPDCATRWARANPGRSKRDAKVVIVGRTQAERRRPSGISVRIAARKAIDVIADELEAATGHPPARARARATELIRPLVPARHRRLL